MEVVAAPIVIQSTSTSAKASITTPIARFAMNKPTTAPHPFEFKIDHPSGLNALDVDIIKLTAQYTVANGKDFLLGLAVREQRNPQFDFLKPTHMLFSYFTTLVDAYAKVLQPSSEQTERTKAKTDRMKALESSVHRWEWNRSEEERKKKESVHVDEERSAFQSIDWFDFTVVETIDFAEDELNEIPHPGKVLATVRDEDDDMDTDMDEDDDPKATTQRMDMPPPPPMAPSMGSSRPQYAVSSSSQMGVSSMEVEGSDEHASRYGADMEMEAENEVDLNVVTDYAPRMAGSGPAQGPMTMVDPISGKVIPVDEMSEHMRVQLMDPRWRIEQKRFQEKQRETGYAEGGSIADSLKQFAKKRGDIFGAKEPANAQTEDKKNGEQSVQWDGHMASIPQMQQLKNEIAARAPQVVVTAASVLPAIGPTIPGLGPQAPRIISVPPPMMPIPTPPPAPLPIVAAPPLIVSAPNYPVVSMPLLPAPMAFLPVPIIPSLALSEAPPPPPLPAAWPSATIPEDLEREMPAGKKPRTDIATPSQPAGMRHELALKPLFLSETYPRHPILLPVLIPAAEFAALHPGLVTVHAVTPVDGSVTAWGLGGQTVDVVVPVTCTIKKFKEALSALLGGMPGAKQQLKAVTGGAFFKDTQTLAELNIGSDASVDLTVKTRGGAKK
jgi:splicing factor 3A subunit 1